MKEPKLKIMFREFIDKSLKEYSTIDSKIIYKYILNYIVLEHKEIFLEWYKETLKGQNEKR